MIGSVTLESKGKCAPSLNLCSAIDVHQTINLEVKKTRYDQIMAIQYYYWLQWNRYLLDYRDKFNAQDWARELNMGRSREVKTICLSICWWAETCSFEISYMSLFIFCTDQHNYMKLWKLQFLTVFFLCCLLYLVYSSCHLCLVILSRYRYIRIKSMFQMNLPLAVSAAVQSFLLDLSSNIFTFDFSRLPAFLFGHLSSVLNVSTRLNIIYFDPLSKLEVEIQDVCAYSQLDYPRWII